MLKYPCLILDHDDTVVQSESTVNYPAFVDMLGVLRPGMEPPTLREFTLWCSGKGYIALCQERCGLHDEEMELEFRMWQEYSKAHTPPCFAGIGEIIRRQKAEGGIVCVASHSSQENIRRDYETHFGILPDAIYSWELPAELRKPAPYALDQIRRTYSLDYSEMLMVDDLMTGYEMAAAREVPFAWAGWGREDIPEIADFMKIHADFCVRTPADLEKIMFPY